MCGIFGFTDGISRDGRPPLATNNGTPWGPGSRILDEMGKSLRHRGPDGQGMESICASFGNRLNSVHLGMRRLAIVDLESGDQPVSNEAGTIKVVFNGEIYNHQELRKELVEKGHKFRSSHSDTEVIPHLYEEFGKDFPKKLNGMFAIALWDSRSRELFLVRDHVGIKPLYFSVKNGELIFASEPKTIFCHPNWSKEPNFEALYHYFTFKNIPAPLSAFKGVYQLRAGEALVWRDGEVKTFTWYSPLNTGPVEKISEHDAARTVLDLLEKSVVSQMQMDVPFGAYLSGGLDSSAVVALMARNSRNPIKTFTLGYRDKLGNKEQDRIYAERMSGILKTEHHILETDASDLAREIPEVISSFDEPFSGTISTYFLTRLIGQHVKVALSGDGADELFGSYKYPRMAWGIENYQNVANRWNSLAPEEIAQFGEFYSNPEELNRVSKSGDAADQRIALLVFSDSQKRIAANSNSGNGPLFSSFMLDKVRDANSAALLRKDFESFPKTDPVNKALWIDMLTLLPDQVLAFVDRLSMAHSVEVRPPFLDVRLVDFVSNLPGHYKIKGLETKKVLKKALRHLLPDDLIDRPKEGFVLPVFQWLQLDVQGNHQGLTPLVFDYLSGEKLKWSGIFSDSAVKAIVSDFTQNRGKGVDKLWNLFCFQIWWERYFK